MFYNSKYVFLLVRFIKRVTLSFQDQENKENKVQ